MVPKGANMLNVFESLKEKDRDAIDKYKIDSNVLMEIAAKGVCDKIIELAYKKEPFYKELKRGFLQEIIAKKTIQIVCGSSDNGGDGLALSRMLQDYFVVKTIMPKPAKSNMCILQKERLDLLGITVEKTIDYECDILVDALFGTGFRGELQKEDAYLLQKMNAVQAVKIALDVPSSLDILGVPSFFEGTPSTFRADITISIGALRTQLYSSLAKDYVGKIYLARLPLPTKIYEGSTNIFLLQKEDAKLPTRKEKNVNKGTFGHVAVIEGEKKGATQLVAGAALHFGAGLITIVSDDSTPSKPDFMLSSSIPQNTTSLAIGPGLGKNNKEFLTRHLPYIIEHKDIKLILDADMFYYKEITHFLEQKERAIVLSPHPKEFASLLKICIGCELSIEEIRKHKIELMKAFSSKYKHVVLLLKDANTFIAKDDLIFINSLGSPSLAKAGTGDVLTGIIAACLSQCPSLYDSPLDCTITASLAHALASTKLKNNYALTASSLIKKIAHLKI